MSVRVKDMFARIVIFFVWFVAAANAEVYRMHIERADGERERVMLDFSALHVYMEVPLKDKRRYDYGECHIQDGAVCTLRYGSKVRFEKVTSKG
jgi:hypothetical protein